MNTNNNFNINFSLLLLFFVLFSNSCTSKNMVASNKKAIKPTESTFHPSLKNDSIIYSKSYRENILTVLLYKKNLDLSEPVLKLNSNESFEFYFDVLDAEFETFQYKIIHCNENWTTSNLDEMEYIDGFNDNYIEYYKQSYNSMQSYINYSLEFPNENLKIRKSGNYVIAVYPEGKPKEIVLTHRFYVTENNIQLEPNIKYPTNLDDKYYKQEVDFNILFAPSLITNPFSNLKVVIEQNHRTDNSCKYLNPNYALQDKLIYNYDEENVFEGGNEFRHIDLTTVLNNTDRVAKIYRDKGFYTCYLYADNKRTYKRYLEYQDINGKFLVKTIDQNDWNLESEYVNVHFSIPYTQSFSDGDIFIYGGFSNWNIDNKYKMTYNPITRNYEGTAYLKQGYYNYTYLFVKDNEKQAKMSTIEGSHFNTENEYIFKVYYSDPGDFYDRLLLYYVVNSREGF